MNYSTLENFMTADLLRGYALCADTYQCLWCGFESPSKDEIAEHVEAAHSHEQQFNHFLRADSLLGFTDSEKTLYKGLYHHESTNSIAASLGLSPITVRVMKRNLFKRYMEAKATVAFCDKLYENSPKRKYNKKTPLYSASAPILKASASKHIVTGFSDEPELYPAVICLFIRKNGTNPEFLIADKAPSVDRLNPGACPYYDVPVSGRVDWLDMSGDCPDMIPPKGFALTEEHYLEGVKRIGKKQISLSSHFVPLESPDPSAYRLLTSGVSCEKALVNVYVYILPDDIASIHVHNHYIDTLDSPVTGSYKTRFVSFNELLSGFAVLDEKKEPVYLSGLNCVRILFSGKPEFWLKKITGLL